MSVIQVGIVDKTKQIDPELIQSVAAALTIQVNRDLSPFWNVQASVTHVQNASKIPAGIWPVFLVASLPPGEGGFHQDLHNQPSAKVIASSSSDEWTIDCSHEVLEMLVDPSGNRLQPSISIEINSGKIVDGSGQFSYLVEACDPCEGDQFAYQIQGIAVSDFITPHFYDSVTTAGTRYSFTGAIKHPREILPAGYITWINLETNEVQQLRYLTAQPQIVTLGPASALGLSLREWVDNQMSSVDELNKVRSTRQTRNHELLQYCRARREHLDQIASRRAESYESPRRRTAGSH